MMVIEYIEKKNTKNARHEKKTNAVRSVRSKDDDYQTKTGKCFTWKHKTNHISDYWRAIGMFTYEWMNLSLLLFLSSFRSCVCVCVCIHNFQFKIFVFFLFFYFFSKFFFKKKSFIFFLQPHHNNIPQLTYHDQFDRFSAFSFALT